jgi:hypothetical protein
MAGSFTAASYQSRSGGLKAIPFWEAIGGYVCGCLTTLCAEAWNSDARQLGARIHGQVVSVAIALDGEIEIVSPPQRSMARLFASSFCCGENRVALARVQGNFAVLAIAPGVVLVTSVIILGKSPDVRLDYDVDDGRTRITEVATFWPFFTSYVAMTLAPSCRAVVATDSGIVSLVPSSSVMVLVLLD